MAKRADVAIETFGTGVAERLGIDAATLRPLNDRLIHCSISGFGRTGPLRSSPGYDVILQAFSGMMSLTGDEDGGYIRSPVSPIDQMTGTHALVGILAALIERTKTGKGSEVKASLFDTALGLQRYNLQSFWEKGVQPPKCGSSHESLCPYQAFEASDGPLMVGVANDNLWRKFCRIADLQDIVDHPKFCTNADRVTHRAETIERVQAVIANKTVSFWIDQLSQAGVPCSPINTLDQLLSHPHTQATGIVMDYTHPVGGPTKAVAPPFRLGDEDRTAGLPPPMHGEHTDDVLQEIGLSRNEVEQLRTAKIIA
jgi:formyl-CoA transferase